jgi:hypothetical protein
MAIAGAGRLRASPLFARQCPKPALRPRLLDRDQRPRLVSPRLLCRSSAAPKPFVELRQPSPSRNVANRDRDGLLQADEDHEPLAARDASLEEVSLQHRVVRGQDGNDHGRIFGALTFVDGGGIQTRPRSDGRSHRHRADRVSASSAPPSISAPGCIAARW